jgi:hypothetical protein
MILRGGIKYYARYIFVVGNVCKALKEAQNIIISKRATKHRNNI